MRPCHFARNSIFIILLLTEILSFAQTKPTLPIAGAMESTPSKSMYYSWVNNAWEGSTEKQTLINYEFFKWLHTTYGMVLDIYLFDSGNIDGCLIAWMSPFNDDAQQAYEAGTLPFGNNIDLPRQKWLNKAFYAGAPHYKHKFPNGFTGINELFGKIGTRLGIWLGPDGFGTTPADAAHRRNFLVNMAKDYNLALFKFDNCCSPLRAEKIGEFSRMMKEVRQFVPDLIALNHRIDLDESGLQHMTTFLWEGLETYIDIHIGNEKTATHARVKNIDRGLPPNLQRLTEDSGVCLSSCLDYWQDDLVIQAFNRNFIMAPEIYGNPWLLKDREFAEMAGIFNLHRKYNDILVHGLLLPEKTYGKHAVSRGNDDTRIITLVNLNWETEEREITVSDIIGIKNKGTYEVRQYHPTEKILGYVQAGESLPVKVSPFRSALIRVTPIDKSGIGINGIDYQVLKNCNDEPLEIELLGAPGMTYEISLNSNNSQNVTIDGKTVKPLQNGGKFNVSFSGNKLKDNYHRNLNAKFADIPVPADAEKQLETLFFGLDNNAMEVRSLNRSGETDIPQVKAARDAFFENPLFVELGVWDKQLFDGNPETGFSHHRSRYEAVQNISANLDYKWGVFRLDIGSITDLDSLLFSGLPGNYQCLEVEASANLDKWEKVAFRQSEGELKVFTQRKGYRYFRVSRSPEFVMEIEGYIAGKTVSRENWKANNLFRLYSEQPAVTARKAEVKIDEAAPGSYLTVPLDGKHGEEGAFVVFKIDGKYIGSPERITSYPTNCWEFEIIKRNSNYTYLLPITPDLKGKKIEVYVLGFDAKNTGFIPSVWISSAFPYITKKMVLWEVKN